MIFILSLNSCIVGFKVLLSSSNMISLLEDGKKQFIIVPTTIKVKIARGLEADYKKKFKQIFLNVRNLDVLYEASATFLSATVDVPMFKIDPLKNKISEYLDGTDLIYFFASKEDNYYVMYAYMDRSVLNNNSFSSSDFPYTDSKNFSFRINLSNDYEQNLELKAVKAYVNNIPVGGGKVVLKYGETFDIAPSNVEKDYISEFAPLEVLRFKAVNATYNYYDQKKTAPAKPQVTKPQAKAAPAKATIKPAVRAPVKRTRTTAVRSKASSKTRKR